MPLPEKQSNGENQNPYSLMVVTATLTSFSQPALQFAVSSYTVAESAGAVTLTVQRTGDTNSAVTVDYATVDGTATNELKCAATNGTLAGHQDLQRVDCAGGATNNNNYIVVWHLIGKPPPVAVRSCGSMGQ